MRSAQRLAAARGSVSGIDPDAHSSDNLQQFRTELLASEGRLGMLLDLRFL